MRSLLGCKILKIIIIKIEPIPIQLSIHRKSSWNLDCPCLVEHDASSTWSAVNSIKLLQVFLQVYCKVNLVLVNTAWMVISVRDWLSSIQERTCPVMVLLGYFLWNKSSILACKRKTPLFVTKFNICLICWLINITHAKWRELLPDEYLVISQTMRGHIAN